MSSFLIRNCLKQPQNQSCILAQEFPGLCGIRAQLKGSGSDDMTAPFAALCLAESSSVLGVL